MLKKYVFGACYVIGGVAKCRTRLSNWTELNWCDQYCEIHEGYKANKTDIIPVIPSSNEVIEHLVSS